MKFICAQPAIDYYTWQVEVLINNFIRNNVNPNDIHIVCSHKGIISKKWESLATQYKSVNFFFYIDDRHNPSYISSVRPNVLYNHWKAHPELENETIFYHDCDIIFTKPIDFTNLEKGSTCYVSDTVSYIGAEYIKSKGQHYFELMTALVNVNKETVVANQKNSGGAQYILKGITANFWNKVYWDCENMFRLISRMQNGNPSEPFQIWCSDMWAVLWNLWVFNKTVAVSDELSFLWATSSTNDWNKHSIYHNAGVTSGNQKMFYKGSYMSALPYNIKLEDFDPSKCSFKYAEEILKTKEVTCLS